MKKPVLLWIALALVALLSLGAALAAQEKGKEAKAQEQPQMTAQDMEAWQKAITPGPHHAHFAEAVGSWKADSKMWMQPGAEPTTAEMKAQCESLFDGRYLVERIDGVVMGMPFHGMSINGYDNLKGKHTMVWVDNMSTGTIYAEGDCSENGAVETYRYAQKDPMTGKDTKVKMVMRAIDKNKHVLEAYMVGDDGKEFKNMEITYTRM